MQNKLHICVGICTFRRPQLLASLLGKLEAQRTEDLFTFSAVVSDNDAARSAEPAVTAFASKSSLSVEYCVEPQQNIALARNRAVQQARGDLIAFIDDDETPSDLWLFRLFTHSTNLERMAFSGRSSPALKQNHRNGSSTANFSSGRTIQRATN